MRLALPALRADANLYRQYVYEPGDALAVRIHAYGGAADPNIRRDHLERWREQTTLEFSLDLFDGGHFYIQSAEPALLERLSSRL
jgi:surfactin synthase thioesterase subunit